MHLTTACPARPFEQEIARHKLSDSVLDRLPTLCLLSPGQSISYAEAKAFHNVLRDMTLIERLIQDGAAARPFSRARPS